MYNRILGVLFLLSLMNCSDSLPIEENTKDSELEINQLTDFKVDWVVGSWRDSTLFNGKVTFAENWNKTGNESFSGEKYQISNGNNSSSTELGLTKTDGKYYYSIVEGKKLTTFIQDSLGENYISFVNTTDEFPTNLNYHLEGKTLSISFSGMANGVFRSAAFKTIKEDN